MYSYKIQKILYSVQIDALNCLKIQWKSIFLLLDIRLILRQDITKIDTLINFILIIMRQYYAKFCFNYMVSKCCW